MPVVLYCPAGDGVAWLFEFMHKVKYGDSTEEFEVYDTETSLQVANKWLENIHLLECDRDKEDHRVLPCDDPFEFRG